MSTTALAAGPANPDAEALARVIRGCEAQLTGCESYRTSQDAVINSQLEVIGKQAEQARAAQASQNGTGSPLMAFIAGMLTTGLVVYLVK